MKWRCGDRNFCGDSWKILWMVFWNPDLRWLKSVETLYSLWDVYHGFQWVITGFRWPIHSIHSIRESIYQDPRALTAGHWSATWGHGPMVYFTAFFGRLGPFFWGKSLEIRFASEKGLVCAKIGRNSALSNHEIIWNPRALSFVFYFLPCGNQTWQWKLLNL